MQEVLDTLLRVADRCQLASSVFEEGLLPSTRQRLADATASLDAASSGSWLGYHARLYTVDLRPPTLDQRFDREWGFRNASNETRRRWVEFSYDQICETICRRAGGVDLDKINRAAKAAEDTFRECKAELLPALDAALSEGEDTALADLREQVRKIESHRPASYYLEAVAPAEELSRDSTAAHEGMFPPHHRLLQAKLLEEYSRANQVGQLGDIAQHAARYLQMKRTMGVKAVANNGGRVFIGHGRSAVWKNLKDFLVDRLGLEYDEFDRQPTAGVPTTDRLNAMLDTACFAFLVLTAEDEHEDGTKHARSNVIHEAGLFQGRYGFKRAIILLEDDCEEFSNVHGLGQIRFPTGKILAKSEDIRRVLEREGILKKL